jgi:hypothetical protein
MLVSIREKSIVLRDSYLQQIGVQLGFDFSNYFLLLLKNQF